METNSQSRQTKDYMRAAHSNCRFGIDSTHYGSTSFMTNRPIYSRELAPKQHIHLDMNHYIRTKQTLQPVFGHFDAHITAFYVPYAMIWSRFNQFISQSLRDGALIKQVPRVRQGTFTAAIRNVLSTSIGVGGVDIGTSTACDYRMHDITAGGNADQYIVTNSLPARNIFSTLQALGYRMSGLLEYASGDTTYAGAGRFFSALPLLAWTKIWYDYYKIQNEDSFPFEPDKVSGDLTVFQVEAILNRMALHSISYPKSYFANNETVDVAGHTNFNATSSSLQPNLDFRSGRGDATVETNLDRQAQLGYDITPTDESILDASTGGSGGGVTSWSHHSTPELRNANDDMDQLHGLTDLAINQLQRMTDYVKRISVAGFSALKRFLAEYGIAVSDDYVLKQAEWIADYTFQLNAQEVTATDGANLGAQTGASVKGKSHFVLDYTAKEFGMLFMFMNIRPRVEYIYGIPRWMNMHMKPMDFYHPDFDGFGYQATAVSELHLGQNPALANTSVWLNPNASGTGVLPVYAEYKAGFSCASGEFARYTKRSTNRMFHVAREIDETNGNVPTSVELLRNTNSWSSPNLYQRIFGDYNSDPFVFHLDFVGYIDAPMKPLFDLPGEWSQNSNAHGKMNDQALHM